MLYLLCIWTNVEWHESTIIILSPPKRYLPRLKIEIKRRGKTDAKEGIYSQQVEEKEKGRELNTPREHTSVKNVVPQTAAGFLRRWVQSRFHFFPGSHLCSPGSLVGAILSSRFSRDSACGKVSTRACSEWSSLVSAWRDTLNLPRTCLINEYFQKNLRT